MRMKAEKEIYVSVFTSAIKIQPISSRPQSDTMQRDVTNETTASRVSIQLTLVPSIQNQ